MQNGPGIYVLDHPYEPLIKIGCSIDVDKRVDSSDYKTMFPPDKMPKEIFRCIIPGYATEITHRWLETCIFRKFFHSRSFPNRELFIPDILEDVKEYTKGFFTDQDSAPEEPGISNYSYDFQGKIVNVCVDYYSGDNPRKGKLILPCGVGKSHICKEMLKRANYKKILILAPSSLLVEQFQSLFTNDRRFRPENVFVTTYQYAHNLENEHFDMVVYDEAHRTCGKSEGGDGNYFRNLVGYWENADKLFMTATEKFFDEEENLYSVDNSELYGEIIYKMQFSEAIKNGYICDYRLGVPVYTSESYSIVDNILSAFESYPIMKTIAYFNTLQTAKEICEKLNSHNLRALYIDGSMTKRERLNIINEFETFEEPIILCSVKTLTEGISIPSCDSVFFAEPRTGEIDVIQNIGRCLRLHPGKDLATVFVHPAMLHTTISNLCEYDQGLKRGKITCFLNDNVRSEKDRDSCKKLISDAMDKNRKYVTYRMLKGEELWDFMYETCLKFEKDNGRRVFRLDRVNGIGIGFWITACKDLQKNGKLNAEKLEKLSKLEAFTFSREKFLSERFMKNLDLCLRFERGGGKIVGKEVFFEGVNIKNFVNSKKQKRDVGKLSPEKLALLGQLSCFNDSNEKKFEKNVKRLLEYEALDLLSRKKYPKKKQSAKIFGRV